VAIIESGDWEELRQQLITTASGNTLKNTPAVKKLLDEADAMQQLLNGNKTLQAKVMSPKMIVSIHLTSADDFDYLFTIPVSGIDDNMIIQQIKTSKNVRTINIREFKKQKVIDIGLADGRQITFADLKGIFAFSFTSFLTESAITGIVSGNTVENDKEFKIVRKKIISSGDLTVFFNFHESGVILPVFMKQQQTPLLQDISNFAGWGAYNISLSGNVIKLEGTAYSIEKNILMHPIDAANDTVLANIPDNAAYVNLSTFENPSDKFFKEWVGASHAFVTLEPLKEDFSDANLFIISLRDKHRAFTNLKKLAADGGNANPVDMVGTTPVYSLKGASIINHSFGGSLTPFENSYFALTDNIAIFANTTDALKFALDKINKGETLNKSAPLVAAEGASDCIYLAPQRAGLMTKALMQPNSSLTGFISQFEPFLIPTKYRDGWLTTTTTMKISGNQKTSEGLLWKTSLKAPAAIAPQIVVNSNTGEKEIFTQDTLGNLYLIDKSGEIQFTTLIDEKILGNVDQLDYYDNGKLQYIFNTATHVYIVDRLGNFVASYPIRLSHPASAGLTLIKDSVSGVYRYYVPCSNGAIYGYESSGRPLPGFSPRAGIGLVSQPLQAIWIDNAYYLLTTDIDGRLSLLNSRAAFKWRDANLPPANQAYCVLTQQDSLVFLNAAGKQLITISQSGTDNITPLIDTAICFAAVATSDTSYLYFYSNHHQVRSYNHLHKFQKSLSLSSAEISSLSVLPSGSDKILIIEDKASGKALIYDLELNAIAEYRVADFQLYRITDLFQNGELIGIQGEKNAVLSCYRIK
jgi:hypothetical protein